MVQVGLTTELRGLVWSGPSDQDRPDHSHHWAAQGYSRQQQQIGRLHCAMILVILVVL